MIMGMMVMIITMLMAMLRMMVMTMLLLLLMVMMVMMLMMVTMFSQEPTSTKSGSWSQKQTYHNKRTNGSKNKHNISRTGYNMPPPAHK